MKSVVPLALVAATLVVGCARTAAADDPKTYLLSITDIPVQQGDGVEAFEFSTWGVTFNSVCRIPDGWTIKAGGSASPDGLLAGEGSLGATWFREASPSALRNLVLVTLYQPVQQQDVGKEGAAVYIPATFKGKARVWADDAEHDVPLSYRNIRLAPARRCPTAAP